MDPYTAKQMTDLLEDIRANLEWQGKMMRRDAFPQQCEDPGEPPGRVADLRPPDGTVIPGSPTYAEDKARRKQEKKDRKKK